MHLRPVNGTQPTGQVAQADPRQPPQRAALGRFANISAQAGPLFVAVRLYIGINSFVEGINRHDALKMGLGIAFMGSAVVSGFKSYIRAHPGQDVDPRELMTELAKSAPLVIAFIAFCAYHAAK